MRSVLRRLNRRFTRRMESQSGSLRSFRHRNFRLLFFSNFLSNVGGWAQRVAQDWLVLELTHSGKELGIVTGLQFAPGIFLSLYAGRMADKLNKRIILIITNGGSALTALVMGWLATTHQARIWEIYLLAFLLGIFGAIDTPVRQSFTAELVGHADVANAISLNSSNFNAGRLIGPGLSGLLIAWFGTGPSFLLNAGSYVFVIGALLMMRDSDLFEQNLRATKGTIKEGWRYVMARRDITAVILLAFFMGTFGLNFQIYNALMAVKVFHRGPATYGSLGSILAIGSFSAGIVSAKLDKRRRPKFILQSSMIFSVLVAIATAMPTYYFYMLALPLVGFAALTTMISANSYVQHFSDSAIKGRVMGIYILGFMGGTPLSSPLIGWATQVIGVRLTIFACVAINFLAALAMRVFWRKKIATPNEIAIDQVLRD